MYTDLHWDEYMNTGRNSKQPASAGTLGKKGHCQPSTQVIGTIKPQPIKKEKDRKEKD